MKTSGHKAWLVQKLVRYIEDSTTDGLLLTTQPRKFELGPLRMNHKKLCISTWVMTTRFHQNTEIQRLDMISSISGLIVDT